MLAIDTIFRNEVDIAKYLFNRQGALSFQINLYLSDNNVIPVCFEPEGNGDVDEDTEAKRKQFANIKQTWLETIKALIKKEGYDIRAISMISEIYLKENDTTIIGDGLQVNVWTKDTRRNWVAVVDRYSREIEKEDIGDEVVSRWDKDIQALLKEEVK